MDDALISESSTALSTDVYDIVCDIVLNSTNSSANKELTLEKYLMQQRGPKHLPLTIVVPLTVVYVLIFVTGVVGNIAVCVVIVRISSMHTATNYYLFNLAVSDLALLLLGLPNDLGVYWEQYPWPFGEACCKFRALVSEMTSYTSVLTIVAFSLERYVAICHPLHSYRMSGLRRAVKIIAILWIIALIAAVPFAVFTRVHYVDWPKGSKKWLEESAFCAMLTSNLVYESSSLLFFLLPMLLMVVLYARIGRKIGSRARPRHALGTALDEQRQHGQSRKAIVRMLASVVVAFFLCWAPFHAQRLLYTYGQGIPYFLEINEWLYYIAGCFYYFGSTVNPILYNVMSVKYRMAFKKTLCGSNSGNARGFREQSSFRDTSVHAVVGMEKTGAGVGNNGVNGGPNGDVTCQRSPSLCGSRICRQDTVNGSGSCSMMALRPPPLPSPPPMSPSSSVTPNGAWSASAPSLTPANSEFESPSGSSDMVVRLSPGGQQRRPRCFTVGRMPRRIWSRAMRDTAREGVPSERLPLAGPVLTTCNGAANAGLRHGPCAVVTGANVETCI